MRIVQIIPGTGGTFYCQNCLRDMELVRTLQRQGHDVIVVPLYLPLSSEDASAASRPAFYSAVALYLRHTCPVLDRALPAAFWRMLDSMAVLRFAARRAGSTRAAGLGDITVSMLRGEQGRQAEELERLVTWLRDDLGSRPDVVVLSNALLLGLARRIKAVLRVPVVCWLQDEHVWADAMTPDESRHVWQVVRERVADVDGIVAVSRTYAERMARVLELPAARIRTIHIGAEPDVPAADLARRPPTVGFVSRLAAGEGFGLFVEAFLELHRDPRFADVRMKATGGMTHPRYVTQQMQRLRRAGLGHLVTIDPDAFRNSRAEFLASLTLLSSPVPEGEAFGTYVVEAMAAGLPVVEPAVGAYPEIFQEAGCGTLCATADARELAATWGALLSDPARLASEAQRGREAVRRHFNLERMAREAVAYYDELRQRPAG
jgi:glycosyltransferase involved in cell wall biosynthesis